MLHFMGSQRVRATDLKECKEAEWKLIDKVRVSWGSQNREEVETVAGPGGSISAIYVRGICL